MIGISGILWGAGSRLTVIGAHSSYAPSLSDTKADDPASDTKADVDRRAEDFLSRGIARSMRSNSQGFGE